MEMITVTTRRDDIVMKLIMLGMIVMVRMKLLIAPMLMFSYSFNTDIVLLLVIMLLSVMLSPSLW